jgi:hypothetical protein
LRTPSEARVYPRRTCISKFFRRLEITSMES